MSLDFYKNSNLTIFYEDSTKNLLINYFSTVFHSLLTTEELVKFLIRSKKIIRPDY